MNKNLELFIIAFVAALVVVPVVDYVYGFVQSKFPALPAA